MFAADAEFFGAAGAPTVKSIALLLVSVHAEPLRVDIVVLDSAAPTVPSKQFAVP